MERALYVLAGRFCDCLNLLLEWWGLELCHWMHRDSILVGGCMKAEA